MAGSSSLSLRLSMCFSFIVCSLVLLLVITADGSDKCERTIDLMQMNSSQHLTTKILLRDECMDKGRLIWRYNEQELHQIVQFRKAGHQSFTVCLSFPTGDVHRFSVHQLRGLSKKQLRSAADGDGTATTSGSGTTFGPLCIESQCSHVSIVLQRTPTPAATARDVSDLSRPVEITYQFMHDQRCSKCTEQCMKNVFCGSDYMFVGTVMSSESTTDKDDNLLANQQQKIGYRSVLKLERFIKHNKTFHKHSGITTHPSCDHMTDGVSPVSAQHNRLIIHPVPMAGEITVYSDCFLKKTKKYFVAANFRAGLKNKGRLFTACAQEDIDYSLYMLQKLTSSGNCCY